VDRRHDGARDLQDLRQHIQHREGVIDDQHPDPIETR
jgi:hypothetical protein